ncbi:hypothetical protein [Desulfotomaculum nigrificans]|uniref:hypothetical protein n=1 Tax=Desulfotomaculum nigrificans TaxID=1565 RepID=UPI0001FAE58D|nr:hypothetical protein [Desulfotomaculum nigrificans]
MKFINLNKLGKLLITVAVILSFLFGTMVENRYQVVHNFQAVTENVNAIILPTGQKIKERFGDYYREAEKTYDALKIGTAISLAIVLSSFPKKSDRGP